MVTFEITYMLDPGDGLESTHKHEQESDDMGEALNAWWRRDPNKEDSDGFHESPFVTKCEIIDHPLMHH